MANHSRTPLDTSIGHCVHSPRVIPSEFARLQAGIHHADQMSYVVVVKALNPFVPAVCLVSVPSRSRHEGFKKLFFGILAALVVILLSWLATNYIITWRLPPKSNPGPPLRWPCQPQRLWPPVPHPGKRTSRSPLRPPAHRHLPAQRRSIASSPATHSIASLRGMGPRSRQLEPPTASRPLTSRSAKS